MVEADNEFGALHAYDIDAVGVAKKIDLNDLPPPACESPGYRWVHLDLNHDAARTWIEAHTDAVVAESLTLEESRPRCVAHDNGVLLILRGVNMNPDSDPEDMVSIRLWVCSHLIVSVRWRRLSAIGALREAIEKGTGPKTVGSFLARLASSLTERMTPVIDALSDQVDALEGASLENSHGLRTDLAKLRRTVIALRRYVAPQRDALSHLPVEGAELLGERDAISIRETLDRVTRLVEEMDAIRERCGVLNDQLVDSRAEEMNRNMMLLSVIAAVFLPLTFLTGLLGVNIGGIPGADSSRAFIVFCAILIAIGGGLAWWFRARHWL